MTALARELVDRTVPFAFLDAATRAWVAQRLVPRRCAARESLIRDAERSARSVFLVVQGSIEVRETVTPVHGHGDEETHVHVRTVTPGHTYGERFAVLGMPYGDASAGDHGAELLVLDGKDLDRLLEESNVFAQAVASILVQRQKVFEPYRRLHGRITGLVAKGKFFLAELVPFYRALRPALHPKVASREIDMEALKYAVLRLPPEVTRTTYYLLTDVIPALYRDPDTKFLPVSAGKARRRAIWQLMPGKVLVLLRDASDLADLLSCLCLYAVEARKLRQRIRSDGLLRRLADLAARPDPERESALIEGLPLSAEERTGLRRVWPHGTAERLRDVLLHHEDIAFDVRRTIDYNARASESWLEQIRAAAAKIVDLDGEVDVHVISSNTHSVGNCLSPYLVAHQHELLAWGRDHMPDLAGPPSEDRPWGRLFARRADLVYATAARYFSVHPERAHEREREERATGRVRLGQTAFTGIEVDLIDARRLRPDATDPDLTIRPPTRPTLIVNVDYAFGEQADEILASLIALFGRSIRSVSVLGKAGALVGRRGDLLLPRSMILQSNDELYPLPSQALTRADLADLASGQDIHEGPVLTVQGTLLQDRPLLLLYKRAWRCIGLEMEGSYFARRIATSIAMGLLSSDVRTHYAYYVSDTPLDPDATLVRSLRADEGVPPLYAITRAILRKILG